MHTASYGHINSTVVTVSQFGEWMGKCTLLMDAEAPAGFLLPVVVKLVLFAPLCASAELKANWPL